MLGLTSQYWQMKPLHGISDGNRDESHPGMEKVAEVVIVHLLYSTGRLEMGTNTGIAVRVAHYSYDDRTADFWCLLRFHMSNGVFVQNYLKYIE